MQTNTFFTTQNDVSPTPHGQTRFTLRNTIRPAFGAVATVCVDGTPVVTNVGGAWPRPS